MRRSKAKKRWPLLKNERHMTNASNLKSLICLAPNQLSNKIYHSSTRRTTKLKLNLMTRKLRWKETSFMVHITRIVNILGSSNLRGLSRPTLRVWRTSGTGTRIMSIPKRRETGWYTTKWSWLEIILLRWKNWLIKFESYINLSIIKYIVSQFKQTGNG